MIKFNTVEVLTIPFEEWDRADAEEIKGLMEEYHVMGFQDENNYLLNGSYVLVPRERT